jgi:hypothetical protein
MLGAAISSLRSPIVNSTYRIRQTAMATGPYPCIATTSICGESHSITSIVAAYRRAARPSESGQPRGSRESRPHAR